MYLKLLQLEIKQFFRSPQFGSNLAMRILAIFGIAYFALVLAGLPFLLYFYATDKMQTDPLRLFCRFFIYYWAIDLVIRYFMQQMPTQNIKPFLTLNITKDTLVKYTILKTFTHFFNWKNLLFLLPFAGLLIFHGDFSAIKVIMFTVAILLVFYFNNFLNILLNNKNTVLFTVAGSMIALAVMDFYGIIPLRDYSEQFFYSFYEIPGLFLVPLLVTAALAYFCYRNIYRNFYLDKGLELQAAVGKTENIEFLNRFGVTGTFLNNDIRLLKRSKAAKGALLTSFLFLFYGLIFFTGSEQPDFMKLFSGIFVTGGFMVMFGQRVPAWDSSYYPLMLTQNVPYKKYLQAKWSLIIISILISMLLATGYLYFGWDVYLTILAGGLYNLGVNSYLMLLAGAYNKSPIDLNSATKAMSGGKNSFNMKIILLMIPQMVLPMVVFAVMKHFFGMYAAVASLAFLGVVGILFRDRIFNLIVKLYRSEKYSALEAFKKGD